MRILLIEDNRDFAESVASFLREQGHSVRWAADGSTALRCLKSTAYDIATIDLRLPRPDGVEIMLHIHEKKCKGNPAVIVITAFPQDLPVPQPEYYGVVCYVIVKTAESCSRNKLKKAVKYCKDLLEERKHRERGAEICDHVIAKDKIEVKEGLVAVVNVDRRECSFFDDERKAMEYARKKGGRKPYVRHFNTKLYNTLRRVQG